MASYRLLLAIPRGRALKYSSYLGGPYTDRGYGIAVGESGAVYLTGFAGQGFPTTHNAIQGVIEGQSLFFTKLAPLTFAFEYSALYGGSSIDQGVDVALDEDENAYITGYTQSDDLPTSLGAVQAFMDGPRSALVLRYGEGFLVPPIDVRR